MLTNNPTTPTASFLRNRIVLNIGVAAIILCIITAALGILIHLQHVTVLAEWYKQLWLITSLSSIFIIALLLFSRLIKRSWLRQERDMVLLQINQQALYDAQKLARLGSYSYDIQTDVWTSSDILDDIFGIPNDYLCDTLHWLKLIAAESRQSMQSYLHFIIEQRLPFDCEYRILRFSDGQECWVHGKGTLQFNAQGKPSRLVGTIQDITKRKLAEIEIATLNTELELRVRERTKELEMSNQSLIAAKEAADAANIAKSTFIATMSHELRTPLNAILGFSELMSQDDSITAKQKETLAIINRSGAHLLSMINDVLDISKIEAGCLVLDVQAFDLLELLHDIGDMISVRAATKKLTFVLDIAPNIVQFIKADSGKLRQILINLLGNAIKFTHQGTVILRADTQLLAEVTTTVLIIEVIDSGIGIPANELADLFHPFVQLVQKKSDTEGTGLGLAISASLAKFMGGHISVSSAVGEGSTFTIELPVLLASANDVTTGKTFKRVTSLAPAQSTWRLLVVDDNADNRLLLVTLLTDMGFQVREAENGQVAIALFEQWQPHLIWMDMRMPDTNGYQATTIIRQLKGGDKVKIIALTASAFKEQHRNIIDAGCDAVLHKPFHIPEIFAILKKYLGVKFVYQETAAPVAVASGEITVAMLSELPLTLRQQLHQAALNLDTEETALIIAQIRNTAPEVADSLQALAQAYQFEQIIQLTETADGERRQ